MINVVASRYAEALFQIGEEEQTTESLYQELNQVVKIFSENKDFYSILKSPIISKKEKIALIDNVFEDKLNINIKNFLKVLIEKNRVVYIFDIEDSYKVLLNEKNNVLEGFAITAVPMQ
ncbi:MAG: ATP synthase F1 subunit delta, partial [Peptostreptococcaceae bacterium]